MHTSNIVYLVACLHCLHILSRNIMMNTNQHTGVKNSADSRLAWSKGFNRVHCRHSLLATVSYRRKHLKSKNTRHRLERDLKWQGRCRFVDLNILQSELPELVREDDRFVEIFKASVVAEQDGRLRRTVNQRTKIFQNLHSKVIELMPRSHSVRIIIMIVLCKKNWIPSYANVGYALAEALDLKTILKYLPSSLQDSGQIKKSKKEWRVNTTSPLNGYMK